MAFRPGLLRPWRASELMAHRSWLRAQPRWQAWAALLVRWREEAMQLRAASLRRLRVRLNAFVTAQAPLCVCVSHVGGQGRA